MDVAVRGGGVGVEKRELLHTRQLRQRKRFVVSRVPESGMRLVLIAAELRVMHEQVGVLAPTCHVLQRSVLVVREHRNLVVGGKSKSRRALIDPVSKRWDRMHQKVRRDTQPTPLERFTPIPPPTLYLPRPTS